jgi:hypothetical protein
MPRDNRAVGCKAVNWIKAGHDHLYERLLKSSLMRELVINELVEGRH